MILQHKLSYGSEKSYYSSQFKINILTHESHSQKFLYVLLNIIYIYMYISHGSYKDSLRLGLFQIHPCNPCKRLF